MMNREAVSVRPDRSDKMLILTLWLLILFYLLFILE